MLLGMEPINGKRAVTIRVDRDIFVALRDLAASERRSITKQIEWLVEHATAKAEPARDHAKATTATRTT